MMRYQIKILRSNTKAGFIRRVFFGLEEEAHADIIFGSSHTHEGAIALAAIAPFYASESVVIVDTQSGGEFTLVKRGRCS